MTTRTQDPDLTSAELVRIVRGGEARKGVGRMRALAAVQLRPGEDVSGLLGQILADKKELPRFRHMAAVGLYRLGGEAGRKHLEAAALQADEVSAVPVAQGLGRIGAPDDMALVERLAEVAPDHARDRAKFAAALLAYRFGLPGHEVDVPAVRQLPGPDRDRARPIAIRPAKADEAKLARAALETEPLDAGITAADAVRIECAPNDFVWLWSADAAGNALLGRTDTKRVAGALMVRSPVENTYSIALIGLATPGRGETLITLHRAQGGQALYAGSVDRDGQFVLKARDWPGQAAVEMAGRVGEGKIEAEIALSATVVAKAKMPRPEPAEKG